METRLFKEDDLERQNIFAKEIANYMEEMTKNQNIKKILIVGLGNSKLRLIHWDQKLPSRLKFCLMCTVWLRGCWLRPVWKLFQ